MGKKGFVDRNRQEAARMLRVDGLLYLGSEKLGAEDTVFLSEMNFRYFITLDWWWLLLEYYVGVLSVVESK